MRPDACSRNIRGRAWSCGPLVGPRSCASGVGAGAPAMPAVAERDAFSGKGATTVAKKHRFPRIDPSNMVVKPLPEFHNHACLRLGRRADLVVSQQLCHPGRVGAATPARPFAPTLRRSCNLLARPPENSCPPSGAVPASAPGHGRLPRRRSIPQASAARAAER